MTESVLYKFKSPTSLDKRQGFSGMKFGQDSRAESIIAIIPPEKSTQAAFQRQNPDRYCLRVADIQESANKSRIKRCATNVYMQFRHFSLRNQIGRGRIFCGISQRIRQQVLKPSFLNLKNTKENPGHACPATRWMAHCVNQAALTFVQVEHGESPLKAVSGLMKSQNADTREGYAEIPTKALTILKGHQ